MTRAVLAGTLTLLVSRAAIAEVDPAAGGVDVSSRFVAGVNIGGGRGDESMTTPQGGGRYQNIITIGAVIGGEHRIFDRLWLGGFIGLSQWTDGTGVDAGYLYRRFDVGVAPRVELYRRPARVMTTSFDLALPFGLSQPFVWVPQRRAFSEDVENGWGWYAGGTGSMTMLFGKRRSRVPAPSFGFRVEIGYYHRPGHQRTTFTPTDATQPRVVEERDVFDDDLVFTAAAVVGF